MSLCIVMMLGSVLTSKANSNAVQNLIVVSPRSLSDAVGLLQENLGCVITFEDAPYEVEGRTEELFKGGVKIPKTRTLTFKYSQNTAPKTVIKELLNTYQNVDLYATFSVVADTTFRNIFHILPVSYIKENGEKKTYNGLLEKTISLRLEKDDSLLKSLDTVCRLSAPKGTIISAMGGINFPPLIKSIVFSNMTTRACLTQLTRETNMRLEDGLISWTLRSGPRIQSLGNLMILYIFKIGLINQSTTDTSIYIEAQRPLSSLLHILALRLGCTIIYEDIEYICPCSILTDRKRNPQVPRGGILKYRYHSLSNAFDIVNGCVLAYNQQNDTGDFVAERVGESIYVYPVLALDEKSIPQVQHALLNKPILLSGGKLAGSNLIHQIVYKISTDSMKIKQGRLPNKVLATNLLCSELKPKTAAQTLSGLSNRAGEVLFWQLHFNPKDKSFTLTGVGD